MSMFSNEMVPADCNAVSRLHTDIDRLFNGFFRAPVLSNFFQTSAGSLMPQMDFKSDDKGYTMTVELPGIEPEAVKIELTGTTLTISGEKKEEVADSDKKHVQERRYGSFSRSLTLPDDADTDHLKAIARNGVLTLTMPRKVEATQNTRTIDVQIN